MVVEALATSTSVLNNSQLSGPLRDPARDVPLEALGLDSLDAVEFAMDLEQRIGIDFDPAELNLHRTIDELAAAISQRTGYRN